MTLINIWVEMPAAYTEAPHFRLLTSIPLTSIVGLVIAAACYAGPQYHWQKVSKK